MSRNKRLAEGSGFNAKAVKRWMDGHLDRHGDEYYDSGGEPDYTKLAEEAAYNNGSEGYTWLDDPDHPIWDLAIEAFDDHLNLDTEVLDDEAFRTSEVKRIFPMSRKQKTAIADADVTLLQTTMSSLSKAKTPDEAMSLLQDISEDRKSVV